MSKESAKWLLFTVFFVTAPVPYFMFVVGGLLPLSAILYLDSTGVLGFKLFNTLHLLIYGPLLYLAAKLIARWLFSLSPPARTAGLVAFVVSFVVIAFAPIYGVGHSSYQPANIVGLFQHGLK